MSEPPVLSEAVFKKHTGAHTHTHKDGFSAGCLQGNILARRIELPQGFQSDLTPSRLHGALFIIKMEDLSRQEKASSW